MLAASNITRALLGAGLHNILPNFKNKTPPPLQPFDAATPRMLQNVTVRRSKEKRIGLSSLSALAPL